MSNPLDLLPWASAGMGLLIAAWRCSRVSALYLSGAPAFVVAIRKLAVAANTERAKKLCAAAPTKSISLLTKRLIDATTDLDLRQPSYALMQRVAQEQEQTRGALCSELTGSRVEAFVGLLLVLVSFFISAGRSGYLYGFCLLGGALLFLGEYWASKTYLHLQTYYYEIIQLLVSAKKAPTAPEAPAQSIPAPPAMPLPAPAPSVAGQLSLDVYLGDVLVSSHSFPRTVGSIKVGKIASAHVRLGEDHKVSRMHAVLDATDDSLAVIDLGSQVGTIVNGQKTNKAHVSVGDIITVGDYKLIIKSTHLE